jgi:hypothetical protein
MGTFIPNMWTATRSQINLGMVNREVVRDYSPLEMLPSILGKFVPT